MPSFNLFIGVHIKKAKCAASWNNDLAQDRNAFLVKCADNLRLLVIMPVIRNVNIYEFDCRSAAMSSKRECAITIAT